MSKSSLMVSVHVGEMLLCWVRATEGEGGR